MTDDAIPTPGPSLAGAPPDQVSADVEALAELSAAGVEIDGEVQVTESTWVIYGRTSYDGEVVVGEYHDEAEATAVFRATTDEDGTIP